MLTDVSQFFQGAVHDAPGHGKRTGRWPLSSGQRRLLLLQQLTPGSAHYNVCYRLRVEGALDHRVLDLALRSVLARHDVLRARFLDPQGLEMEIVELPDEPVLRITDLSGAPTQQQADAADSTYRRLGATPFDLAAGPPFYFELLSFGPEAHLLFTVFHHIVTDGRSAEIFFQELQTFYRAATAGEASALAPLRLQYTNYARRQYDELADSNDGTGYWTDRLSGAPTSLDLPTSFSRPEKQTFEGAALKFDVPQRLVEGLRELARKERCTIFMVLLAAVSAVLARYAGQDEVVLGTPVDGREDEASRALIGFFVNTVALRFDLSGDPSFSGLLRRVRTATLQDFDHAGVPFEQVVNRLPLERDPSRSVLFQTMISMQTSPERQWELAPGLQLRREEGETNHALFDLMIHFDHTDTLRGDITYNISLFDAAYVERLSAHLLTLMEDAVQRPSAALSTLAMLMPDELQTLLIDRNRTALPYDQTRRLHDFFTARAAATPEAIALIFGELSLTYRELDEQSNGLAAWLQSRGVGPEIRVALCLQRTEKLIIGMLAVLKAGGAYVPLDPTYPVERLRYMFENSNARLLLMDDTAPSELWKGEAVHWRDAWQGTAPGLEPAPCSSNARNTAYLIYTSGSTGRPKGVVIEHAAGAALVAWAIHTFPPEDFARTLASTSICFDLSIFEIFVPLALGGTVVLVRNVLDLLDRESVARTVTLINTVPSAAEELAACLPPSVRVVNVAGEPLRMDLVRKLYAVPTLERVQNLYGPSETTTYSTWSLVAREERSVSIGGPIANTRVYVLDRNQNPVPSGFPGELYIGGAGLARGYQNLPASTAEKFLPDPFSPGERLYRTSDLVRYRTDGALDYLGRLDHQVKVRGYRIELEEIESHCMRFDGVEQVAALVFARGDGDKQIVAYVVPTADRTLDLDALRIHLAAAMPAYSVPDVLINLPSLPRTLNGKLDRKALPAPDQAPASAAQVGPRDAAEEAVSAILCEILGVPSLHVHDSFFDLGGHSLMAMRAVVRLSDLFGKALPLPAFFEAPSVAALAAFLAGSSLAEGSKAIEPTPRDHALEASFAQTRLFFLQEFDRESNQYNVPLVLRLQGPLAEPALQRALQELNRRHDVLRTHFVLEERKVLQIVGPSEPLVIARHDLRNLAPDAKATARDRIVRDETARSFDLTTGPVWRQLLLQLGPEEHVLLLTTHHVAIDGWSLNLLSDELATLYESFAEGKPSPLPEPVLQYSDYAAWQRTFVAERLQGQLAYWKHTLEAAPRSLDLPASSSRTKARSAVGGRHDFVVPAEGVMGLRQLCREQKATLFMGVFAVYELVLARFTGQEDMLIGTPMAGRVRSEIEKTLGYFVNTLILRADLSGQPSFRELISRARVTALGAYAHQDVPFERVVEEIAPDRDVRRSGLFQTMLVLQNTPESEWRLPGLAVSTQMPPTPSAKCDLTLFLKEDEGGLAGTAVYASDLFEPAFIAQLFDYMVGLLLSALRQPDLPIVQLGSETEVPAPRPEARYPMNRCLHDLLSAQAEKTPDAFAIAHAGRLLTYRELHQRASFFAEQLVSAGIGSERVVAFASQLTPGALIALFGISKAGAAYAPLNTAQPAERQRGMLEDLQPARFLNAEDLAALETMPCPTPESSFSSEVSPRNLAYVMFTSGSTGRPKGVLVEHRQIVSYVSGLLERTGFAPEERYLLTQPLHVDASATFLFGALASGGCLHLGSDSLELEPEQLQAYLYEHRIDYWKAAPSHVQALWTTAADPARLLPAKALFVGGEAATLELFERCREARKDLNLFNQYGPTESTVGATLWCYRETAAYAVRAPLGEALDGVVLYLLDADGRRVPPGSAGELWIGGSGVARGYLNRPAETATAFQPDPFHPTAGTRMYRTGDFARRRPGGPLEYLGRRDDQVKVRGFRVELAEVETVLASLPSVRECAVVLAADTNALRGYICWTAGSENDFATLQERARASLPDYMVPTEWCTLGALPRLQHGKLDRKALREQPGPAPGPAATNGDIASTSAEQLLALIWKDVLRIGAIGPNDSFFELGGHSLLAMQITARVRQIFNIAAPLRIIFEAPTIRECARALQAYETIPGSISMVAEAFVRMQAGPGA